MTTLYVSYLNAEARPLAEGQYWALRESAHRRFDVFVDGRDSVLVGRSGQHQPLGELEAEALVLLFRSPSLAQRVVDLADSSSEQEQPVRAAERVVRRAWKKVGQLCPEAKPALRGSAARRGNKEGPKRWFSPAGWTGAGTLRWAVVWPKSFGAGTVEIGETAIEPALLDLEVLSVEATSPDRVSLMVELSNASSGARSVRRPTLAFAGHVWLPVDYSAQVRAPLKGAFGRLVREIYRPAEHLALEGLRVPAHGVVRGLITFTPPEEASVDASPPCGRAVLRLAFVDGSDFRVEVSLPAG